MTQMLISHAVSGTVQMQKPNGLQSKDDDGKIKVKPAKETFFFNV